jgi:hypothetical protein
LGSGVRPTTPCGKLSDHPKICGKPVEKSRFSGEKMWKTCGKLFLSVENFSRYKYPVEKPPYFFHRFSTGFDPQKGHCIRIFWSFPHFHRPYYYYSFKNKGGVGIGSINGQTTGKNFFLQTGEIF